MALPILTPGFAAARVIVRSSLAEMHPSGCISCLQASWRVEEMRVVELRRGPGYVVRVNIIAGRANEEFSGSSNGVIP